MTARAVCIGIAWACIAVIALGLVLLVGVTL